MKTHNVAWVYAQRGDQVREEMSEQSSTCRRRKNKNSESASRLYAHRLSLHSYPRAFTDDASDDADGDSGHGASALTFTGIQSSSSVAVCTIAQRHA